jgi:hypothetical protein
MAHRHVASCFGFSFVSQFEGCVCVSCRIIGIEYGMVVFFLRRMKCVKQLNLAMYAWHKEIFNMALDV